jgi:hypothetical protein
MSTKHLNRGDGSREGILRGPSAGLRVWADWLIDVRKRWHEGDPPRARWRLFGSGAALLALATIIEKVVGG